MTKAAGILFTSTNGTALFLRRTATAPDCPGCWDFPGGTAEGDETAEQTAVREAREEAGLLPDGVRLFHTRTMTSSAPRPGVAGPGALAGGLPDHADAPAVVPLPGPPMGPALAGDVDFTTFLQRVTNEFTPELNDEHDGFCWAPLDAPPEPLHPGCRIALDRLGMNELDVARAIADGRLTSPQRYENVTLWAIRITGTGASYRPKIKEFVYRDGENHITPEALMRFNGLPVIMKHPKKALLDSKEFRDRIVGTIFLPYVAADEAWGIAKIYDDEANKQLQDEELSTSPGVNFNDYRVNRTLRLEDGSKVLIEGDPSLYDHVAICELGVWDKGDEPSGIRSEAREDSAMADKDEDKAKDDAKKDAAKNDASMDDSSKKDAAKKDAEGEDDKDKSKDDSARKDADAGKEPDNMLSHVLDAVKACTDSVNAVSRRMDAIEGKADSKKDDAKKDDKDEPAQVEAERTAADKAKKDAAKKDEDEKAEKAKEDARKDARADSVDVAKSIATINRTIEDMKGKIMPVSDDDHDALANAWARADDVFTSLGQKTPRPMPGETAGQYRRRYVKMLKEHSTTWKTVDTGSQAFADDAAFSIVENQVLAEAAVAARNPTNVPAGQLRMVEKKVDGHTVREFFGQPRDWMDSLAGSTGQKATGRFNQDGLGRQAN